MEQAQNIAKENGYNDLDYKPFGWAKSAYNRENVIFKIPYISERFTSDVIRFGAKESPPN